MKVNNVDNTNFGKSLIARCKIMDKNNNSHPASLYEYSQNDYFDRLEVSESYSSGDIGTDFYRAFFMNDYSKFFVLKNDKENKIASASEIITHKYYQDPVAGSSFIEIETLDNNSSYKNAVVPMLAHITKLAQNGDMDSVIAFECNVPSSDLAGLGFNNKKRDIWVMPKNQFDKNIKKAQKKTGISYTI